MQTTSTFRQKDGNWQIIISWKDSNGKWRQKSKQGFTTKREAKEYESKLLQKIKKQPHPVDKAFKGITLLQFTAEYLKSKKSLIKGSKRCYENAVNALGDLAEKPLESITFRQLQNVISEWTFGAATQNNYRISLRALFRAAIKPYRIIAENPMDDIEISKEREKKERRTVTDAELQQLLKDLKHDAEATLAVNVLYYTGLRRGELLALSWDKIDWKESLLTVDTQYNKTITGKFMLQPPKSRNGFRVIPIPAKLLRLLKQYKNKYPLQMDRKFYAHPEVVIRRVCVAMRAVHPDLSPHCLRHTYATNLLAQGVDVRTVAALIGDDTRTVISTYIHYTDEMRKAAQQDIEKIFA